MFARASTFALYNGDILSHIICWLFVLWPLIVVNKRFPLNMLTEITMSPFFLSLQRVQMGLYQNTANARPLRNALRTQVS